MLGSGQGGRSECRECATPSNRSLANYGKRKWISAGSANCNLNDGTAYSQEPPTEVIVTVTQMVGRFYTPLCAEKKCD